MRCCIDRRAFCPWQHSAELNFPDALCAKIRLVSFAVLYRAVGGRFRRRRRGWLLSEFAECRTVVDLGGTVEGWAGSAPFESITLVNIASNGDHLPPGFRHVQADALCLALPSASFDLAYSNSAIEHLGTFERQHQFARQMLRLGRRVYCQTPDRWFPIEPHYLAVFLHWLPAGWFGHRAHRWLTAQGLAQRPNAERSAEIRRREAIRLLTKKELQELFPGCQIRVERFCGWPKSYTAWR